MCKFPSTEMKTSLLFCALVAGVSPLGGMRADAVETDPVLPATWPAERFEKLIQQSPFAPATAAVVPNAPGFAANLYVSSVAAIGDKYLVTLASREDPAKIFLTSGEAEPNGISIVDVQYSDEPGKSKVTVKKGSETGVLAFDEVALQQRAAQANAAGAQMPLNPQMVQPNLNPIARPARNPVNGGQGLPSNIVPPGVQRRGGPTTPGIPGQGNQPAQTLPQLPQGTYLQQNPAVPATPETRRRIRIINSRP